MALIGVLGGMGPLATVDFMRRVVELTHARCDQEHLPMIVANLAHTPDRRRAILGDDVDPLPALLAGIDLLNRCAVDAIAIPCNTVHHWYPQMRAHSAVPVLHIALASVAALPAGIRQVAVLATRGTLVSGFYEAALHARGIEPILPSAAVQRDIDASIDAVKAGEIGTGAARLARALAALKRRGVAVAIMACTEIPIAALPLGGTSMMLIDSTLELARAVVVFAAERGWVRAA